MMTTKHTLSNNNPQLPVVRIWYGTNHSHQRRTGHRATKPTWFRAKQRQFEVSSDQVKPSGWNSIPDVASSCYWFLRRFGAELVRRALSEGLNRPAQPDTDASLFPRIKTAGIYERLTMITPVTTNSSTTPAMTSTIATLRYFCEYSSCTTSKCSGRDSNTLPL